MRTEVSTRTKDAASRGITEIRDLSIPRSARRALGVIP